MKVFAYIGSNKGEDSNALMIAKYLLDKIEKHSGSSVVSYIYHGQNAKIKECTGCCNCFANHKCLLDEIDDMGHIKHELIDSDLIIIGSPVYFHHVSASMKKFIDRTSYWTHILKLAGKIGISISTSSTNGNEYVDFYLDKFFVYQGMHTIKPLSFCMDLITHEQIDSILNEVSKEVVKCYENLYTIEPTKTQENIFNTFKNMYVELGHKTQESRYWHENKLIQFETFKQFRNHVLNHKK